MSPFLGILVLGVGMGLTWLLASRALEYAVGTVPVSMPNPVVSPDRLRRVTADMRSMGPPVLRAVREGETWHLVEGSHRVKAAQALGLPVELVEISTADPVPDHDWPAVPEVAHMRGPAATAGELLASASRWGSCELSARRVSIRCAGSGRAIPAWLL